MDDNLSRRKFLEQLGLGTAAGLGLSLLPQFAEGRQAPSSALPTRVLGRTGAHVSILAFDCGSRFLMYEDEEKALAALNKPADLSAGAIVIFNVWGFLLGIAAVWVYAAIRPRYGAGPRTAVRAGLVTWAFAVFLANLANYPLGLLPARLLVITSIVALVEVVVATLVGAWLYKEEEAQAVRRATA